jgi:hypothetical protein
MTVRERSHARTNEGMQRKLRENEASRKRELPQGNSLN